MLAMVLGHTLQALLIPGARIHEWIQNPWELRGIAAPLFLLVSGWAVVASVDPQSGAATDTYGSLHARFQRTSVPDYPSSTWAAQPTATASHQSLHNYRG
jgi:hypothetical protein